MKIEKYINILACPSCQHQTLKLKNKQLYCPKCHTVYPIKKDIPFLLPNGLLDKQENNQLETFNKHYKKQQTIGLEQLWRQSMIKRIFNHQFIKKIHSYLDIGCGSNAYTVFSALKNKQLDMAVGIDISAEAIKIATQKSIQNKTSQKTIFIIASAQHLPFKKNTFDYISAISVLEHLKDQDLCLSSINHILKQDKYFFMVVPNSYRLLPHWLRPIKKYFDDKIGHLRSYSKQDINKLSRKHDFVIKKIFYNGHLLKIFQIMASRFNIINQKIWWYLEEKDINLKNNGAQLNVMLKKT